MKPLLPESELTTRLNKIQEQQERYEFVVRYLSSFIVLENSIENWLQLEQLSYFNLEFLVSQVRICLVKPNDNLRQKLLLLLADAQEELDRRGKEENEEF